MFVEQALDSRWTTYADAPACHVTHTRQMSGGLQTLAACRVDICSEFHVQENFLRAFENFIYMFGLTSGENKEYDTTSYKRTYWRPGRKRQERYSHALRFSFHHQVMKLDLNITSHLTHKIQPLAVSYCSCGRGSISIPELEISALQL
jgi:hypothetical protein